jgi:hypothetical protein
MLGKIIPGGQNTEININKCTSFFKIISLAISRSRRSPTMLMLVAKILLACCKDSMKWMMHESKFHILVYVTIREVLDKLEALVQSTDK